MIEFVCLVASVLFFALGVAMLLGSRAYERRARETLDKFEARYGFSCE